MLNSTSSNDYVYLTQLNKNLRTRSQKKKKKTKKKKLKDYFIYYSDKKLIYINLIVLQ